MMRVVTIFLAFICAFCLSACILKGTNPDDPYEAINRKVFVVNDGIDTYLLKPVAKGYKAVLPSSLRAGVNNVFNNVGMLPTVANDLLQADWDFALRDTWRFIANTTFGIGGIFDAARSFGLAPHSNDLGLTFAKWGDKKSPYILIPLLGPSTIRDSMGLLFDYTLFTPYPYIESNAVIYGILALRYVDLRSQFLDTDKIIDEALDKYAFIRDAYLQHRRYLITGEQEETGSLYVGEQANDSVLSQTPEKPVFNTSEHAAHSPASP